MNRIDRQEAMILNMSESILSLTRKLDESPMPNVPYMPSPSNLLPSPTVAEKMSTSPNPKPIRPTYAKAALSKAGPTPASSTTQGNPRRLILQFAPRIPPEACKNGRLTRDEINKELASLDLPHYFRVVGVEYSYAGNPIVMTHEKCIAEDLMAHADIIASCIAPDESYRLMDKRPDMDFHRVKLNGIPTDNGQGDTMSPADVSYELGQVFEAYKNMNHAIPLLEVRARIHVLHQIYCTSPPNIR
ncbi:hypothetical protein BS47DRAFT_612935 [Hydnum rufescens UP504]|uniref:Uncharacterized protein n=1 Tax=Hydnum rufescens UP504 TaxID=1448309 RepID=A0A9P6DZC7_9AGAM|nr:hypothetical protein BS47DRAFT_612935 [Hydnum rufescens UP504]